MLTLIIQVFFATLGVLVAALSVMPFLKLSWPAPVLWFLKLYVSALSPLLMLIGLVTMVAGIVTNSLFIILIAAYDILIFGRHMFLVTRPPGEDTGFERVFGSDWRERISMQQKRYFLSSRKVLNLPTVTKPDLQQNVSFATIPGSDRKLLCDIWQPPADTPSSGLAFIYLHGSAFYFLDKDFGTRPLFHHLAAQGHLIMDVAYRLAPETDVRGMVNDAERAVAWMKENAHHYKIDPDKVVLAGGSAGGHLALLAAYTSRDHQFSASDLEGKDTSVCGVVSLYGSSHFEDIYYHTNQHLTTRSVPGKPKMAVPTKMPAWIVKKMGNEYYRLGMNKGFENAGAIAPLLGGHPDECPEAYALYSVINHVHSYCPPTLLIHGADDIMAPLKSTQALYKRLENERVPAILHIIPQTDHAFDLILPAISPSAHNAIFDVERFLALIARHPAISKLETEQNVLEASEV